MLRLPLLSFLLLSLSSSLLLADDPLPAWRDTPIKASLIDFVKKVTTEGGADFVLTEDRIAVFDNDGTLCSEQPMYMQFAYGQDRAKELAAQHPQWKEQQPFKAALEDDIEALGETEVKGLTEIVAGTHVGKNSQELQASVRQWLATARHPTMKRPYTELVYQPMLELLTYLRANGFKTYIVTGSATEFLRAWSERVYGIPPEQIIGSNVETVVSVRGATARVEIVEGAAFANNRAMKAIAIDRVIGRTPILAFGNSDGDLDMLRLASGSKTSWAGIVHHTDAEREFAYDSQTHFGRLNAGLKIATRNNWWVVNMKRDWASIFPDQEHDSTGSNRR